MKRFRIVNATPSSVNNTENVGKCIGHTDNEKSDVIVVATYIYQMNRVNPLNHLQIEPN